MQNRKKVRMCSIWMFFQVIAIALVVIACGPAGIQHEDSMGSRTENGDDKQGSSFFFGWNIKNATGTTIDLGDVMTGDIAIVSFFATYCTRCKQKLIDHQSLHEKYGKNGLSVLGVSVDEPETQSDVGTYVRSRGFTFPIVIDSESRLVSQFNPRRTLPFSVLIDRQGNVLWSHVGYAPGDEKLTEERIMEALSSL